MPTWNIDIPDDPEPGPSSGGSGSSYNDERVIDSVYQQQSYDASKLTRAQADELLDKFGIPGHRGPKATINEKLEALAEFFAKNGDQVSVEYKKDKAKKPNSATRIKEPSILKKDSSGNYNIIQDGDKIGILKKSGTKWKIFDAKGKTPLVDREFEKFGEAKEWVTGDSTEPKRKPGRPKSAPPKKSAVESMAEKIKEKIKADAQPQLDFAPKDVTPAPMVSTEVITPSVGAPPEKSLKETTIKRKQYFDSRNVRRKIRRENKGSMGTMSKEDWQAFEDAEYEKAKQAYYAGSTATSFDFGANVEPPVSTPKQPSKSSSSFTPYTVKKTGNAPFHLGNKLHGGKASANYSVFQGDKEVGKVRKTGSNRGLWEIYDPDSGKMISPYSFGSFTELKEWVANRTSDITSQPSTVYNPKTKKTEDILPSPSTTAPDVVKEPSTPVSSSGSPPEPPKPPAPPAGGDPGDPDDFFKNYETDQPADKIDPNQDMEARERKDLEALLSDEKKRILRERSKYRTQQSYEFRKRRKELRSQYKEATQQIAESERTTASDRIIRRLAAFGIGRNLGGSGQLFAGAMEYSVFRPEEEKSRDTFRSKQQEAARNYQTGINLLEDDAFRTSMNVGDYNQQLDDMILSAQRGMKNAPDNAERKKVLDSFLEKIKDEPKLAAMLGMSGGGGSIPSSGGGGVGGFSLPVLNANQPFDLKDLISPEDGFTQRLIKKGTQHFKKFLADRTIGKSNFMSTPEGVTTTMLAANVITDTLSRLRETATQQVQSFGSMLNINPLTQSALPGVSNFVGGGLSASARVAGAGAGAAVGASLGAGGGPLGMLVGSAVGTAVGGLADPIVEAIKQGNALMENFTKNSMDFGTIGVSAQEEIATLLRKIEADFAVSAETMEFAEAQGELQRAVIAAQEAIIKEFGPYLADSVKALTTLVEWGTLFVPAALEAINSVLQSLPLAYLWLPVLKSIFQALVDIGDKMPDPNNDPALAQEIASFFSTQGQFQGTFQKNGKPFTRFGTNIFAGP